MTDRSSPDTTELPKCDVCNGEGRVAYIQSAGGFSEPADCYKCGGSGRATQPAHGSAGSASVSIELMQRVWDNLYFDKDEMGTFQQTLNEVVDWLASWDALPSTECRRSPDAAQTEQEPRLAGRLTDVIFMLDAPDAYNREYIAAVCRSILSSISSTEGKPPACPTCGGHGLIGGFVFPDQGYDSEPCPTCSVSSPPRETPCAHEAIIGLDGKWHCQKCAEAIEMAVAHSRPQRETP